MINKFKNCISTKYVGLCNAKDLYIKKMQMNKKGISQLVEVAGVLAIIVACIILVVPQAKGAVSQIWSTVTNNAKSFFNSSTT